MFKNLFLRQNPLNLNELFYICLCVIVSCIFLSLPILNTVSQLLN